MLSKLESRKECMEQIELIQHWNYFCSLAERLDDTKHYIDHGLQEHDGIRELVHGKVYSDIFKQIIVLAASEFEIMSKALCSANILWRSILVQLKKKFEENNLLSVVKFPLIYQFMSVSEMRETVIHFLPEYAKCIGRPCYFFIDGLDHAARSKDARNSFLSQLPRPEEIGDDFYFVLVGQPINDGYPSWMKDNKGITYYSMPALDTDDVVILLEQSGVAENTVDMENLAKTVISVIGNNVLNIIFAILELKKMVLPLSFEAIEKELNSRFLNKQIDKYYEWIISSQEKSLLLYKIEAIMAFSSKRINAYDVAQMCGVEHDEAAFVLNGLYPIIVCEGDRYFAFHNDVRLFLQNAIIHNSNIKGITESIINRIKQDRELWKYRYDE